MMRLITRVWPAMSAAAPVDVGRWVVSWRLWLVLLPFSVFSLTSHLLDELTLAQATLTALVACLVSGLVLLLASATVFRNRRTVRPRTWLAILVWILVGVVTYLAGEVAARWAFSSPDSSWHLLRDTTRYSIALVLRTALVVIFVSALINTRDTLRATRQAFSIQHDELGQTESYLTELRKRYVAFVTEAIEPRLHVLMDEVSLLKASPASSAAQGALADELEDFGSHQVRSLSHQIVDLAYPAANDLVGDANTEVEVPGGWALTKGWIREIPPALPWIVVFGFTRFGYGTFDGVSVHQAVGYVALCTVGWLILTLARLVGGRTSSIPNRAPAWVGLAAIAAIGLASVEIDWAFESLGDTLRSAGPTLVGHVILTLIVVWIINFTLVQRARYQDELVTATRVVEQISMRRDVVADQLRHRLAGILHGPVQGRLALASMTIRQYAANPSDDPAVLGRALTTVQQILDSIDQELSQLALGAPATKTFDEFIADLRGTWSGVLEVEARVSPSAAIALAEVPDLRDAAVVVSKEAIMNARSHGRARVVFLTVDLQDRSHLRISVLDDGCGVDGQQGSGLGSRLFDRATSSWSLTNVGFGGSLFSATIDVPAHVQIPFQLARVG